MLPEILSDDILVIEGIPVMPLFDLLVMKMKGWWDHRNSPRRDLRAKEQDDASDVFALLDRAMEENISYSDEYYEDRHQDEFMDLALLHSRRFVSSYGGRGKWRRLGFPV
jgi:hypothetical protein